MRLFVRGRSLGIQPRLTVLAVATALPLVALASFAILRMVDDQRTQIKQDVAHRVENLLWDVDRQIGAIQAELQVLAVSPSLQDGDFAAFDRQMRAYRWALGRGVRFCVAGSSSINPNRGCQPSAHSKLSSSAQWK